MQKLKTIIVDDNRIYRQSLKMALGRCPEVEGIEIDEADNGLMFLRQLESFIPSFVLMDIKMPKMNGIQATQIAIEKYPNIKIIAISTMDDYQSVEKMKEAGAKAFIAKGFDKQTLISIVMQVLKGNQPFILKI